MREIMFRAYNKVTKEMLSNVGIHPHLIMDLAGDDEYYKDKLEGRYLFTPNHESIVLMQYTGLKDKNGKDIYEGDIVVLNRSGFLGGNFQAEGVIVWHYHKWQWKRLSKYDNDEENGVFPTCDIWVSPTWLEVIGNIYENPELL